MAGPSGPNREDPTTRTEFINTSPSGSLTHVPSSSSSALSPLPSRWSFFPSPPSAVYVSSSLLLTPSSTPGMILRESLFAATDYNARLPRSAVFDDALQGNDLDCTTFEATLAQVTSAYERVPNIDLEPGLREEMEAGLARAAAERVWTALRDGEEGWRLTPDADSFVEAAVKG
eukprot:CAMPEP_0182465564 /NCGR_PEP_ID=MMETSP1319-20130603/10141_1 /TAXON_ID=172717 /ORGANISM="Bolidomonas pacifica, Strain RCC208" /LENGTH=173 /DNA_ID=CAMNT_0024665357 /DNA_START=301 /DNA_END=818 /DNA_ORIENTATION=+